jgi:hypothetical protein
MVVRKTKTTQHRDSVSHKSVLNGALFVIATAVAISYL